MKIGAERIQLLDTERRQLDETTGFEDADKLSDGAVVFKSPLHVTFRLMQSMTEWAPLLVSM